MSRATTLSCAGCAPLYARATAPDESSRPLATPPETAPRYSGPTVQVHVESTQPVLLVELGDRYEAIDACAAPCDREVVYDVVVGALGPAPPNDGGPARPPPSFVAAETAGLAVTAVGLSLWIGGLIASIGNSDSGTSQSRELPPAKPSESPFPVEGSGPPQGALQSALPRPTTLPLLAIHF